MNASTADPAVVRHDVPCIACGYNLRGLRADGTCPECGTAGQKAMDRQTGLVGDEQWIRRMIRGCSVMLFAPWLLILSPCLTASMYRHGLLSRVVSSDDIYAAILLTAPSVVGVIGVLMLTVPEPGASSGDGVTWRRLGRWVTPWGYAVALMALFDVPRLERAVNIIRDQVSLFAFIFGAICLAAYCRHIARRMNRAKLGEVMWVSTIVTGACAVGGSWLNLVQGRGGMTSFALVVLMVFTVLGLCYVYVLLAAFTVFLRAELERVAGRHA